TGRTALKSEAHQKGFFHPTVHVWCYTDNGKILLQQRGKSKSTFPLLWDVSVAGHVGAGEHITMAALREVEEEIGLSISENDLQKIGVFKSIQKHGDTLIDSEFHHTFLYELQVPFESLKKQDSEVAALTLVPLTQFAEEIWGLASAQKYVPHDRQYYTSIIKAIQKKL
ncbi:MAG: NUDIX domain-containing protein, partial [Bacteroidota bacterium]